ncbi:type VI secretion system ATPase TssH [Gynuella sunshinyii]|uniref:ATPase with chaperone activity, ATP-binding subunit n=1 Tax=Gynuella sunshinyii YC6258 TaxID=1445510 RepID=A0A0C5VTZ4_9GAMM|nr:type VI secretion system ATPase TssH [Gynuella sunshinyii]AJQ93829.1 ATPase with chaperone activity, ATP-binding subunit [Gynuella sunshinyii YC6258]
MDNRTLRVLIDKLNSHCGLALEAAAGFAASRGHKEILPEHLLLKLLEEGSRGHIDSILEYFSVDQDRLWNNLIENINQQRTFHEGKPAISAILYQLLEKACLVNALYYTREIIDSAGILEAIIQLAATWPNYNAFAPLDKIQLDSLHEQFSQITYSSEEGGPGSSRTTSQSSSVPQKNKGEQTALDQFTTDLTEKARSGGLDPINGRHDEIRMAIDILCRRRKNNPILVGEPGVGKTAVVEGLALRIVEGDVPEFLKNIRICVLDLGLLQAGAGVKGEFERRLKQVIEEVTRAETPVMLFIDEAHTLIGAGGEAGMSDAANLLKPALARGELRTIAATTWSEYKQYFERDPALARRFQMVKVEEPTIEAAIHMLSGLKQAYESHHQVHITDKAIESAVRLSDRYINGRYLPDKAIDLIDTAAARVKMGQSLQPQYLEGLKSRIVYLEDRLGHLEKEDKQGLVTDVDVIRQLKEELANTLSEATTAELEWRSQNDLVRQIQSDTQAIVSAAEQDVSELLQQAKTKRAALSEIQQGRPWVQPEVNDMAIADVIADWTGIPVGSMVKDELHNLLAFESALSGAIIGQSDALRVIGQSLRSSKANLRTTDGPQGVFLLAGPSGVGKTETARKIAEHLFGSERSLTVINMSEYQEAHTVSQLKGSPPGYVGYGQGGILTEAVRQKPYSVVLLDEVEKAHVDVMNLFYQVFDRGFMRDGEGREIDFKNTIILMTSNLGSNLIQERCVPAPVPEQNEVVEEEAEQVTLPETAEFVPPTAGELVSLIQPVVSAHFAPALAARMQLVPFMALDQDALTGIIQLKLDQLAQRLQQEYKIELRCDNRAMEQLLDLCRVSESGARLVNRIIEQQLMPGIANQLLHYIAEGDLPDILLLDVDDNEQLSILFLDRQPEPAVTKA